MTPVIDPIDQLRLERPPLDAGDPLATPRVGRRAPVVELRRRRRARSRALLVAAVAVTALLTGIMTSGESNRDRRGVVGISVADAREQAITALRGVTRLRDYTSTSSWIATEIGGEERKTGGGHTYARVGGAAEYRRWSQADFAGVERREGMLQREVGTYRYEEVGNNRYLDHPWAVDARVGWHERGGHYTRGFAVQPPPDFSTIIEQLEREDLIDARREEDGTTIVEISRPARELAPIISSMPGNDPIASFAGGFVHGRDGGGDTEIDVRVEIDPDGLLSSVRLEASGMAMHADNRGGTEVRSRIVAEQSWRPRSTPITAPDPSSVVVVGNLAKARRGELGAWGPQGTLDTMSFAKLRELRAAANRADLSARAPRRPGRSYPGYFARRREEMRAFRTTIASMYPFDRAAFATDEDCVPLWPDTGRAMERSRAEQDPEQVGWQCDLGGDVGVVVIMPEPSGLTEWRPPSGGVSGFARSGYRPE